MAKISGNKGEWSELYAALKIAVDGALQGVDVDLSPLAGRCLKVHQVIRPDFVVNTGLTLQFAKNEDGHMCSRVVSDGGATFAEEKRKFGVRVDNLFNKIKIMTKQRQPNRDADVRKMVADIGCRCLSVDSDKKKDVLVKVFDPYAGGAVDYGFSIKSYVGSPPTLLNASGQTSLVFEIQNSSRLDRERIEKIRASASKKKYRQIVDEIHAAGANLVFRNFDEKTFENNLRQLDDGLPEIYAEAVRMFEETGRAHLTDIFAEMERKDFKHYGEDCITFYKKKFKRFLVASALGMRPESLWNDVDDATGGFVFVKPDGEIAAFYITDRRKFENFLMCQTSFMHPTASRKKSTGKVTNPNRVWLFEERLENGRKVLLVHLNVQIRFLRVRASSVALGGEGGSDA